MKVKLNIILPDEAVLSFESEVISSDIKLAQIATHIFSFMFPTLTKSIDQEILRFYLDQECQNVVGNEKQLGGEDYYMKLDAGNYAKMLNNFSLDEVQEEESYQENR